MTVVTEFAELRLFRAVADWDADARPDPAIVIDAACQALIDGLDSPALRELAGASPRNALHLDIRDLVTDSLGELGIPFPGTVEFGHMVAPGGGVMPRPATDTLRLDVVPFRSEERPGFQVRVLVNGVDVTADGAGAGMDPYDVLIPVNRFTAGSARTTFAIARCPCGFDCDFTDVTVQRDGDVVHWEWAGDVPMERGVTFAAEQYDTEVARVAADHSWETPERTAGRLVLTGVDLDRLRQHGLSPDWVSGRDGRFRIAFRLADKYQIFLGIPWGRQSPEELAREVVAVLTRPPQEWPATWHAMKPAITTAPAIAGPSWLPYRHNSW